MYDDAGSPPRPPKLVEELLPFPPAPAPPPAEYCATFAPPVYPRDDVGVPTNPIAFPPKSWPPDPPVLNAGPL
jgi:hypothetical protein